MLQQWDPEYHPKTVEQFQLCNGSEKEPTIVSNGDSCKCPPGLVAMDDYHPKHKEFGICSYFLGGTTYMACESDKRPSNSTKNNTFSC